MSMENLIQFGNNFTQSINRLEAQISCLINIVKDRNEKTLSNTFSTIPDCPSHLDRNQKSLCLGDLNQDSISSHQLEFNQSQIFDKLTSFSFNEIELECECDPDPQLCDLVPNSKTMLTPLSLPNLDPFPELTLIPVPIDLEIESPILDNHIPLMENECESTFVALEPTIEPNQLSNLNQLLIFSS